MAYALLKPLTAEWEGEARMGGRVGGTCRPRSTDPQPALSCGLTQHSPNHHRHPLGRNHPPVSVRSNMPGRVPKEWCCAGAYTCDGVRGQQWCSRPGPGHLHSARCRQACCQQLDRHKPNNTLYGRCSAVLRAHGRPPATNSTRQRSQCIRRFRQTAPAGAGARRRLLPGPPAPP